jgi:hypothetical protein
VDDTGHFLRQAALGFTLLGALLHIAFQLGNLVLRQEGEVLEVSGHIAVVGVEPELVEAVGRGAFG